MSKNTITTESIFNKIEERFHKIPSLIFQDTPKSIIFFIVLNNNNEDNYEDEDNNNSKQQQQQQQQRLIIDVRIPLQPKISRSNNDEEFNVTDPNQRIVFEFDNEYIFTNVLKENNLKKGLASGKINIEGNEKMLRKVGPLIGELLKKDKHAPNKSVDNSSNNYNTSNDIAKKKDMIGISQKCIISDIVRRRQIVFYRLTPVVSSSSNYNNNNNNNKYQKKQNNSDDDVLLDFDIERRYSEFVHLGEELIRMGIKNLPKLPAKSLNIFQNSQTFLSDRRDGLEKYINDLFEIPNAIPLLHIFLDISEMQLNITTTRSSTSHQDDNDNMETKYQQKSGKLMVIGNKHKNRLRRKLSHYGVNTPNRKKNSNYNNTTKNADDMLNMLNEQDVLLTNLQNKILKHQKRIKSVEYTSALLQAQFLQWIGPAIMDVSFWAGFTYLGYNLISPSIIYFFRKATSSKNILNRAKQSMTRISIAMVVSYLIRWRIVSWPDSNVYKRQFKFMYVAICILLGYKIARRQTIGMNQEEKDAFYLYVNRRFALLSYLCMAQLGGMFMKAGQYMGARSDVTPPVFVEALSKLQDQVPSREFSKVKSQVCKALGSKVKFEDVFKDFETEPIAAASIAQVHKARLKNGRNNKQLNEVVAVKVQHVGIEPVMRADLQALDWVTRLIAWSEPEYNFEPIMTEWRNEAIKELDFCREHENVNIVAKGLNDKSDFNVWVPTTVDQLQPAKEMMVLEYAKNSVKVTDVETLKKYNVNFDVLLEDITKAFAHQMFHIGVFSGDPHPGNILVELPSPSNGENARAVLLDFGLAKRLSNKMRLAFAKLVVASADKDYFMLLESFDEMGLKLNRLDSEGDVDAMRFLFRDTAPPKEARSQLRKYDKAMKQKVKVRRERKVVKPVDAFPGDLLFFLRAQDLLRGLCSTLNVRQSPLKIFSVSSRKALEIAMGESNNVPLLNQIKEHSAFQRIGNENNINTELEVKLKSVLNNLQVLNKIVGCQIAVTHNETLVADVCAGLQEKEANDTNSRSITPYSLTNCFSVTKAITVAAVHMLVDQGKIQYEEKVGTYWPAFGVKHPEMTVGEMISHRARMQHAMPKDVTFKQFCDIKYMSDAMCDIESDPFDEEVDDPNKMDYHYLSFGWLVAGLVSSVTGMPFQEFVLENIFKTIKVQNEARIGVPKAWCEYDNVNYSRFCKLDVSGMIPGANDDDSNNNNGDKNTDEDLGVSSEEMDKLTERLEKRVEELGAAGDDDEEGEGKNGSRKESMKKLIASFKNKPFLFDVRCYNSKAVRQACIPAANGHFSARALATFYTKLFYTNELIKSEKVRQEMIKPVAYEYVRRNGDEDGDFVKGEWAYGYKLYPFFVDGKGKMNAFGHTGAGGSIAMCIPHSNVTLAITINKMTAKPHEIWKPIFEVIDEYFAIGKGIEWYQGNNDGNNNSNSNGMDNRRGVAV